MRKRDSKGNKPTVIVRREEDGEPPAHGGAWKVAYADFVTAMMAFFLLMWLLNATTEEQRRGLADYFAPTNLFSHGSSGTGQPFGGHTAFDSGAMVSDRGAVQAVPGDRPAATDEGDELPLQATVAGDADQESGSAVESRANLPATRAAANPESPPGAATPPGAVPDGPPDGPTAGQPAAPTSAPGEPGGNAAARETAAFKSAAEQIATAVRTDPELVELARQLAIDITPEGLRIQILDEERRPMFALGAATPNERARLLLRQITPILTRLRHKVSIAGHTDAAPFASPDRSNWELSTERANATRRLLLDDGFPEQRIQSVTGHAERELLLPNDPLAAANRRIAIVVLREATTTTTPAPPKPEHR